MSRVELNKEDLQRAEDKLFAQYQKAYIEVEVACADFLSLNNKKTVDRRLADLDLPFPVMHDKDSSRTAPRLVSIADLAVYAETQRRIAQANYDLSS